MKNALPHGEITEAVIGAAFEVYKAPGYGFLESVYRNAMAIGLKQRGFDAVTESRMEARYQGEAVAPMSRTWW